jgi:hypothetical protein
MPSAKVPRNDGNLAIKKEKLPQAYVLCEKSFFSSVS